jgi:uncharacterized integral membrane protein
MVLLAGSREVAMARDVDGGNMNGTKGRRAGRLSGGAIAALAGGGVLVIFMAQNTENVTLQFLFWTFTCPLWLFTPVVAMLGAILWIGLGVLRRHRRRRARREVRAR